jgi:hypothetical protein
MMAGMGVIIGRGTYLAGGVARVWEVAVATGRVEWANWDPSPFTRNTTLGVFCGQVNCRLFCHFPTYFLMVKTDLPCIRVCAIALARRPWKILNQ